MRPLRHHMLLHSHRVMMSIRLYLNIIEYLSDDVIKIFFQHFHDFCFHISVEHDEKPPHTKFGVNRFMGGGGGGGQDMAA